MSHVTFDSLLPIGRGEQWIWEMPHMLPSLMATAHVPFGSPLQKGQWRAARLGGTAHAALDIQEDRK